MSRRESDFARLFVKHQEDLLRYILGCVPSHSDALDILQETATALWRKFDQYDREKPFGPWARKFAHVQVLKFCLYRKRERHNLRAFSEAASRALAEEYEQHVDVLAARSDALAGCLEKLTAEDRALLEQRYFESVNMRQVAAECGRSEDQIYRQLNRIRRALMKCIDLRLAEEGLP